MLCTFYILSFSCCILTKFNHRRDFALTFARPVWKEAVVARSGRNLLYHLWMRVYTLLATEADDEVNISRYRVGVLWEEGV